MTAEPYLCKDLLSGKVTAAKPNLVFNALQTPTSVIQIGAMSTGKPIPDLSDEKVAQHLSDVIMGKKSEEEEKEAKPIADQDVSDYTGQTDK